SRLRTPSRSSTESSASITVRGEAANCAAPASVIGDLRGDEGGPAEGAGDVDGTVQRGDAAREPLQPASLGIGAADAVVLDGEPQPPPPLPRLLLQRDADPRGAGVLDDVGDALARHEVGGG